MGSGSIAPYIFSPGNGGGEWVTFMPQLLYLGERVHEIH